MYKFELSCPDVLHPCQVHRAVVLPLLSSEILPLDLDSPTLVFPGTSVTALQAIVTLFYEGSIITSQQITTEVLTTLENLGIDPDKFTKNKVGFRLIIFKSSSLLLCLVFFRRSSRHGRLVDNMKPRKGRGRPRRMKR